ncbi:MAG: TolB family protein, partial [Anaerolineae bacterium]
MKRIAFLALGLVLALVPATGGLLAQEPERSADWSPEWYVGKILFKSDRDGQEAFFAVNPDGSGLVRVDDPNVGFYYAEARTQDLTSSDGRYRLFVREVGPDLQIWQQDLQTGDISYIVGGSLGADYEPAWAPDSRYVAYVSQSDGNDEIHLYDRLTNTDRRLTQNTWEWDKHPSFSPDGSQIVFYSNRQARFRHIWLMNADGSQPQNLSGWGAYNDWDPVWIKEAPSAPIPSTSPLELDVPLRTEPGCQPELEDYVGKILFKSDAEGLAAIYLLDPDTGEACRVDDPNVGFYYAEALRRDALSPDGRYRLFVREIGSNHQIWLEDTETGDIAYVAGGAAGADYEPAWSPDGLSVAYVSQRDGNDEIHLLDRGSGQDRRLTQNNWEWDKHPSFNADGSQIVFWSNREAGWKHLWVMNADGSGQRSLGRSGNWNDWDPVWVKAEPSPAPELSTLPLPTGEELPAPAPIELEPLPVEWYVGKILFKSDRDGQEAFFAVNPDGSGLVRVDDPNVGFYYAE